MTKRMLIDASHAEETRVVVLDGSRLEDFDVETSTRKQLKGNIYLAKVVRVEPSLQAAFVEYGGNRHGFLAFSEIHPDYYQIPVADRQRLIELQAEEARAEEEEEDRAAEAAAAQAEEHREREPWSPETPENGRADAEESSTAEPAALSAEPAEPLSAANLPEPEPEAESSSAQAAAIPQESIFGPIAEVEPERASEVEARSPEPTGETPSFEAAPELAVAEQPAPVATQETAAEPAPAAEPGSEAISETEMAADVETADEEEPHADPTAEMPPPETVGGEGDATEESREKRIPPRFLRSYKIQEVIRRRQILLVQVVKEERGTKGAALTTYLSLAGRYCVLMPNSPRGGGISRKITSAADRKRLKEITAELDIPHGMGLIVRTAGANRPKAEIKRDCEYLLRLWDDIREHTLRSVAPALIYEEANLIKRAIRDVYSRDLDDIIVDGEEGWRAARDFMRMLMPSHAKKVQLWRDGGQSLFARYQVDSQLDAMLNPTVQLRSGGYLIINQTEALVAIDVNSGRSTRERGIEETALRTNLEAADEVARQLRLRDLAGLIVIDFIDMESKKHNAMVERRLKEALKNDRARIQVGHISHFGLMEMSRQRLRPSLAETSLSPCPHCGGSGHVRSVESSAIHVLRQIEEEGGKRRAAEAIVYAATRVVLYILNNKRERLAEIEARYGLHVTFAADDELIPPQIRIERVRAQVASEAPAAITPDVAPIPEPEPAEAEPEEIAVAEELEAAAEPLPSAEAGPEEAEDTERRRRRRRRRRGGGGRREDAESQPRDDVGEGEIAAGANGEAGADAEEHVEGVPEYAEESSGPPERERGPRRRGGRRRGRDRSDGPLAPVAQPGADQPDLIPYAGPTPADPFGGAGFDIFELMDQAEQPRPAPTPISVEPAEPASAEPTAPEEQIAPAEPVTTETAPQAEEAPALEPANDTALEPAIKPIIVGAETEPAKEKKRGWWRR